MKTKVFDKVVEMRLKAIKESLIVKGAEYVRGEDRLHNFTKTARFRGKTKEEVLWGFVTKQITNLDDMIEDLIQGTDPAPPEMWDEKIKDIINYMCILEAILVERFGIEPKGR